MATKKTKTIRAKTKSNGKNEGRPVLVCTDKRGVFFGYAADTSGDPITLRQCRNVVYWPAAVRGFLGLATGGPLEGSRVGPAAISVELRGITCVVEVSPGAVKMFEQGPWR